MSNKKHSDSVWKDKLWGQIGEKLRKSSKIYVIVAHFEVNIILLSPKF
jgi:hypothetical protein